MAAATGGNVGACMAANIATPERKSPPPMGEVVASFIAVVYAPGRRDEEGRDIARVLEEQPFDDRDERDAHPLPEPGWVGGIHKEHKPRRPNGRG